MESFFGFEDTDNFLDSVSGVINRPVVNGDAKVFDAVDGDEWRAEFANEGIGNMGLYGKSLFGGPDQVNLESTSMSVNSFSQESSSNTMSPNADPSLSSSLTSPENLSDKDNAARSNRADEGSPSMDRPEYKGRDSFKESKVIKPVKKDKVSHNMIEKKYRTNINSKILALREAVPSLRIASGNKDMSVADLEGLTPASKLNKASVLTKATEYIKHLEKKNDLLRNQNLHLQKLIQEANINPAIGNAHSNGNGNGFGFVPQVDQSYNVTPVQDQYYSQQGSLNSQVGQQQGSNKYLMGGMAAVVGTTLFGGGDGEFQGLSALPFSFLLPNSVLNPSYAVTKLWYLFKIALLAMAAYQIILPYLSSSSKNEKTSTNKSIWENYLLISLGFKLPLKIGTQDKQVILESLLGNKSCTWFDIFKFYLELSVAEIDFENCVLNLLIGKLIILRYPRARIFMSRNMEIKGSLVMNLDCRDEKSEFCRLNKFIKNVDGLSFLGSEALLKRLSNLVDHRSINDDIFDGQNHVKYIEIHEENKDDYCKLLVEWRLLDIVHHLNLVYLEIITEEDLNTELLEGLKSDMSKVEKLIKPKSTVEKYFTILSASVESKNHQRLAKNLSSRVFTVLDNFNLILNGQDLTDEERISESDEEEERIQYQPTADKGVDSRTLNMKSAKLRKKLITDLNIVSHDEAIALMCSVAIHLWSQNKPFETTKVLKYINIDDYKMLNLANIVSFASLFKDLIPGVEDDDTIHALLKIAKQWVDNTGLSEYLDAPLRSNLSNMIYNKSVMYNNDNESDEY